MKLNFCRQSSSHTQTARPTYRNFPYRPSNINKNLSDASDNYSIDSDRDLKSGSRMSVFYSHEKDTRSAKSKKYSNAISPQEYKVQITSSTNCYDDDNDNKPMGKISSDCIHNRSIPGNFSVINSDSDMSLEFGKYPTNWDHSLKNYFCPNKRNQKFQSENVESYQIVNMKESNLFSLQTMNNATLKNKAEEVEFTYSSEGLKQDSKTSIEDDDDLLIRNLKTSPRFSSEAKETSSDNELNSSVEIHSDESGEFEQNISKNQAEHEREHSRTNKNQNEKTDASQNEDIRTSLSQECTSNVERCHQGSTTIVPTKSKFDSLKCESAHDAYDIDIDTSRACPSLLNRNIVTLNHKKKALEYILSFKNEIHNPDLFRKFEKSCYAVNLISCKNLQDEIHKEKVELKRLTKLLCDSKIKLTKTSDLTRKFIKAVNNEKNLLTCSSEADEKKKKHQLKKTMELVKIVEEEMKVREEMDSEVESIKCRLQKALKTIESYRRIIQDFSTAPFKPCCKDTDYVISSLWTHVQSLMVRRKQLKRSNRELCKEIKGWTEELTTLLSDGLQGRSLIKLTIDSMLHYLKASKFSCSARIPTILHQLYPKFQGNSLEVADAIELIYKTLLGILDGRFPVSEVDPPVLEFNLQSRMMSFEDGFATMIMKELLNLGPGLKKTVSQIVDVLNKT